MKSYVFDVVVEQDGQAWHAYCPALEKWGAATWGQTKSEAVKHIQEVVELVVEELAEDGIKIPESPAQGVQTFPSPHVAVTLGA